MDSDDIATPSVKVTTSTGQFVFDELVCTAPLGWLKRNSDAFQPQLPSRILTSIKNLSYGRLEKVYISFPSAFWVTPGESRMCVVQRSPMHSPGLDRLLRSCSRFYTQFIQPSSSSPDLAWSSLELVSLAAFSDDHARPTLLFYVNGPCATHVTSMLQHESDASEQQPTTEPRPDRTDLSEVDRRLLDFFHPFFSRLPDRFKRNKPFRIFRISHGPI